MYTCTTEHGRQIKPFFIEIPNFWSWAAFDPTKIFTQKASQNDCLNLSFVKDIYIIANN